MSNLISMCNYRCSIEAPIFFSYPHPFFKPFLEILTTLKVIIDYKSGWDNTQP